MLEIDNFSRIFILIQAGKVEPAFFDRIKKNAIQIGR